jgi:parvulin-like peptidyl-prolyl isomerase
MTKSQPKRTLTKKHLARVEREQIQRRYIIIITSIVVIAVVALIVVGFVVEGLIKPNQPVAQVNEGTITTDTFQARVRYQRYLYVAEYLNTYQFIQSMGDPNSISMFESYLLQIQSELAPEVIGLNTLNAMIEDELVREEAQELGIEVSREEVENRINQLIFQYYPDGTPTPAPTRIDLPTPTLSVLQKTLLPPTPTEVLTETQDTESTATPTATSLPEDPEEAEPTPTTALPTPTIYTESSYQNNYRDFMSYINNFARVSEEDIYSYYESQVLREKVSEAVIPEITSEEEVLWAHHILFQDQENGEQQALDFLSRIESGESFGSVAQQLAENSSEETEDNTIRYEDLGWFGEGMMVEPFDTAARALEVGEISEPVQTTFGWHVIQLLGRDTQPRDQANIDRLHQEAFQEWLDQQQAEAQVDIVPNWVTLVPDEPDIPEQIKITPTG